MDELEISGKRYISARRAGKEYKYHSDYIGQLIRGKKLLGRKVGRSWYVELDSTAAYFGGEAGAVPKAELVAKAVPENTPSIARPAKVVEPVAVVERVLEKPVEEFVPAEPVRAFSAFPEERIKVNKAFAVEETPRDSIHIPVRVQRPSFETSGPVSRSSSLMYVSDDEPYIPMGKRFTERSLAAAMVMPQTQEEIEEVQEYAEAEPEVQYYSEPQRKGRSIMPALRVFVLGVIVLGVVMGSSVLVSSHTVIEAGKSASVGFSVK